MTILFLESNSTDFVVSLETSIQDPKWLLLHSVRYPLFRVLEGEGQIRSGGETLLSIPAGEYTLVGVEKALADATYVGSRPARISDGKLHLQARAHPNKALRQLLGISKRSNRYGKMASDSIYPTIIEPSSGEDYRLKRIADVQTSIEPELGHYQQVLKKYKRAHSGLLRCSLFCGGCTVVLSGGSLASAITGFGLVAGAPLAGIAAILGIVSGSCAAIARRFEKKISKHERTIELAQSRLSTIIELVSPCPRNQ
ncbi:hypothetical protein QZH41_017741, partial [Actinostola sp. cb2023]